VVATALAAIVGLVTLLWPDAPPRLKAQLDHIEVDTNVRLSEFSARQRVADAGIPPSRSLAVSPRSRQGGQAMLLLATHGGSRELPLLAGSSEAPEDFGPGEGEEFPDDGTDGFLPGPPVEEETPKSPSESDPPRPESQSEPGSPEGKSGTKEDGAVSKQVDKTLPLAQMFPDAPSQRRRRLSLRLLEKVRRLHPRRVVQVGPVQKRCIVR